MKLGFRLKFFIQKRVQPIEKMKWDIKSIWYGYRPKKYAEKYGEPIDMGGIQHIHPYPQMECNLDCHFCQNKFYTEPMGSNVKHIRRSSAKEWLSWLNRMYNVHHIDIQGGEPMYYPEIVEFINGIDHHNVVMFTNLPRMCLHLLDKIRTDRSNITLAVSYHDIEESKKGRSLKMFCDDYKKIPKRFNPTVHIIDIPEISVKNIHSAFAREGIFVFASSGMQPTPNNQIPTKFKRALCRSDMECISPDMKVYRCMGIMIRDIEGVPIAEYDFSGVNDHKWCDWYGLCGPCTNQKSILEIE